MGKLDALQVCLFIPVRLLQLSLFLRQSIPFSLSTLTSLCRFLNYSHPYRCDGLSAQHVFHQEIFENYFLIQLQTFNFELPAAASYFSRQEAAI